MRRNKKVEKDSEFDRKQSQYEVLSEGKGTWDRGAITYRYQSVLYLFL